MSIFEEAEKLINNDRRAEYGPVDKGLSKVALHWSAILDCKISPRQVALCMICWKIERENFKHKRDNLVDICGYAGLVCKIEGDEVTPEKVKSVIQEVEDQFNNADFTCTVYEGMKSPFENCNCANCKHTRYYGLNKIQE